MKSTELSLLALVITLFAVLVQAPTASAVTVHLQRHRGGSVCGRVVL
jgi:hypothetical protein